MQPIQTAERMRWMDLGDSAAAAETHAQGQLAQLFDGESFRDQFLGPRFVTHGDVVLGPRNL